MGARQSAHFFTADQFISNFVHGIHRHNSYIVNMKTMSLFETSDITHRGRELIRVQFCNDISRHNDFTKTVEIPNAKKMEEKMIEIMKNW